MGSDVTADTDTPGDAAKPARGNLVALAITQILVSGSGLVIQILLARYLGRESYGTYAFLLSVTALFAFVADMNLQVLLARETARDHGRAARFLGTGLLTATLTSLVAVGLTVAYAAVGDGRGSVVFVAIFAGVALGTTAVQTVVEGVLQGLRRMQPFMVANLVGRTLYVVGTATLLLAGMDLVGVFIAQALGPLVTALILLRWFTRNVEPASIGSLREVGRLVRDAIPFSLNRLFGAIYLVSDVLVVKAFWDDGEVGTYRVATLLLLQLPLLAVMLNRGIFPKLARAVGDVDAAGAEVQFAARILLVVSVPMAVGGLMLAGPLLVLLVGDGYDSAVLPFAILMPLLPVRFVNNLLGNALSALNQQVMRTRATGYAAAVNLAANFAVVPFLGAFGAALTTLGTDTLLLVYQAVRLAPHARGVRIVGILGRLVLPTLAMAAVLWLTPDWHVLLRVLAGAIVYGLGSWALRAWRVSDLRALRSI